ncbi:Drought induced 19 protein type, zinc-binding domain,Zinc finger C2H2-type [Cinara cedri]|uniref:Drought induced 19 protein type, zinc-binding domain,Zinc finger C2H2-type n=1 Tax=Cinara cedri TaxID=506608 RepID=A0A5E4NB10_9HEMI|nr:Drought induced 19 protein type, zinc-binding domain,Zinc finger C2H2-type [Cinara cedri]
MVESIMVRKKEDEKAKQAVDDDVVCLPGYQILPPPANGGINEPQDCPYCRRTFSCYYSLKRHFQDKHGRSDTLYVCEFCRRRYRTKNSLTTHKSLQHRASTVALKRLMKTVAAGPAAPTTGLPPAPYPTPPTALSLPARSPRPAPAAECPLPAAAAVSSPSPPPPPQPPSAVRAALLC